MEGSQHGVAVGNSIPSIYATTLNHTTTTQPLNHSTTLDPSISAEVKTTGLVREWHGKSCHSLNRGIKNNHRNLAETRK